MQLYARVNILDGAAVRLPHGTIDEVIHLDADPVDRAEGWVDKGADRLHIVDLDAAINGDYKNRPLIREIIAELDVPVQVAGGIRTPLEIDRMLDVGAWRVAVATLAIVDQVLFWEICREHPGKILVSLDVTNDLELVTRGWTEGTGMYLEETLLELSAAGAAGYMITEVGRDALTEPPNYEALRVATSIVDEEVIAAGGVRDLDDIRELLKIKGLTGVVVGREVTAGRFTVEEALDILHGAAKAHGPWSQEDLAVAAGEYRALLEKAGETGGSSREILDGFVRWLGGGAP